MNSKLLLFLGLILVVYSSCAERVPRKVTVVPHVVKSIDTIQRYNPNTLNHETCYRYEFWDSAPPIILDKRRFEYKVGDTIEYIYYQY